MWSNEYVFQERWEIPGFTPQEVWPVLADATSLPAWWKGVYRSAELVQPEGASPYIRSTASGWLPYVLRFDLTPRELRPGELIEVKADGDFDGVWRAVLTHLPGRTRVDITWTVTVEKPLLRAMSWLLKPLFAWNHRWTMPIGRAGLIRYLNQQRAQQPQAA